MQRYDSLQAVRFVAALAVVESHAALNLGAFGRNAIGGVGVDVFFVLSGFIITRTARDHPRGFLAKRAIRVLPTWYLWLIPWIAIPAGGVSWRGLLASLALWPATDVWTVPYLGVGWSLCFEALFYLAVWFVLRGLKWWVPLIAFAACAGLALLTHLVVFDYLGSPLIVEFLAGVALAFAPQPPKALAIAALAVSAALFTALAVFGDLGVHDAMIAGQPHAWLRPVLFGVPAVLLVLGALAFPRLPAWLSPAVFLGDASYSIYLTHLTLIAVMMTRLPTIPPLLAIAACVLAGAAVYQFIERPLLRALRKVTAPTPKLEPA